MPCACLLGRHLCHHFSLFPPALSVFEEIFPWSLQHLGRMTLLTHSLLIALSLARALLFEKGSNLWGGLGKQVCCSDALRVGTHFSSRVLVRGKHENSVGGRNAGGSERAPDGRPE